MITILDQHNAGKFSVIELGYQLRLSDLLDSERLPKRFIEASKRQPAIALDSVKKLLQEELVSQLKREFQIVVYTNETKLIFPVIDDSFGHKGVIYNLKSEIQNYLINILELKTLANFNPYVWISNTVHNKITSDEINFNFKVDNVSLHDIHKNLQCSSLMFQNKHRIADSVLGLLLIKDLTQLYDLDYDVKQVKWFHIVKKHFDSDKDILECQEELRAKGFKAYAKL